LVSFFTNAIYKKPITRPVAKKHEYFQWFIDSANTKKESLNKVMKRISVLSTFLKVGVLIDAKRLNDYGIEVPVVTKDQKKNLQLYPYITILKPENIIDWYYDNQGLAWVKIKEISVNKEEAEGAKKETTRYLLYTRDYFREGRMVEGEEATVSSETVYPDGIKWGDYQYHSLGEVPIKFVFQHDIDEDEEWESNVEESAMIQRRIANWMSNVDENIWSTCHSGIAVPIGDHWETIRNELNREVSGKKIIPYEAGSTPPTFIRDNLINIPQVIQSVELEIRQLYSNIGVTAQNKQNFMNQSGTSK
jgi:hypothetical protein